MRKRHHNSGNFLDRKEDVLKQHQKQAVMTKVSLD